MDDGNVFNCWDDRLDAIYHAELGASAAILRAGYNLDCLLQRCEAPADLHVLQRWHPAGKILTHITGSWDTGCSVLLSILPNMQPLKLRVVRRYQGYDWRDRRNWGCNGKRSPVGRKFYNSTLSVYDLFFVKVKTSLIEAGDIAAQQAVKFSQ